MKRKNVVAVSFLSIKYKKGNKPPERIIPKNKLIFDANWKKARYFIGDAKPRRPIIIARKIIVTGIAARYFNKKDVLALRTITKIKAPRMNAILNNNIVSSTLPIPARATPNRSFVSQPKGTNNNDITPKIFFKIKGINNPMNTVIGPTIAKTFNVLEPIRNNNPKKINHKG